MAETRNGFRKDYFTGYHRGFALERLQKALPARVTYSPTSLQHHQIHEPYFDEGVWTNWQQFFGKVRLEVLPTPPMNRLPVAAVIAKREGTETRIAMQSTMIQSHLPQEGEGDKTLAKYPKIATSHGILLSNRDGFVAVDPQTGTTVLRYLAREDYKPYEEGEITDSALGLGQRKVLGDKSFARIVVDTFAGNAEQGVRRKPKQTVRIKAKGLSILLTDTNVEQDERTEGEVTIETSRTTVILKKTGDITLVTTLKGQDNETQEHISDKK